MLVVALILIFGVKLIKQTTDLGKSVDISVFKKDLDNSVQQIYTYSARSSQNLIIKNIPRDIRVICFIDLTNVGQSELNEIPYEEIKVYAETNLGSNKNLFFISKDFIEPQSIKHLTTNPNPFCTKIERQTLTAKLTNTGEKVVIGP